AAAPCREPLEERFGPAMKAATVVERADANVQEVALGEIPSVTAEVGLGKKLGDPRPRRAILEPLDADARLALLGDHDRFFIGDLAESACDRTVVTAGADDDLSSELATRSRRDEAAGT